MGLCFKRKTSCHRTLYTGTRGIVVVDYSKLVRLDSPKRK